MADKTTSGEVEGAMASGGESQGKDLPNKAGDKEGGFSGGQSERGYHGTGSLGEDDTGQGNENSPAKE